MSLSCFCRLGSPTRKGQPVPAPPAARLRANPGIRSGTNLHIHCLLCSSWFLLQGTETTLYGGNTVAVGKATLNTMLSDYFLSTHQLSNSGLWATRRISSSLWPTSHCCSADVLKERTSHEDCHVLLCWLLIQQLLHAICQFICMYKDANNHGISMA